MKIFNFILLSFCWEGYQALWVIAFLILIGMVIKLFAYASDGEDVSEMIALGACAIISVILWVVLWDDHPFFATWFSIVAIASIYGYFFEY